MSKYDYKKKIGVARNGELEYLQQVCFPGCVLEKQRNIIVIGTP